MAGHHALPKVFALPATAALVCLAPGISAADEAADWNFTEVILDGQPLANNRINDLAIGDVDGDGVPDVWVSGRNGSGHQAAWYRNPGDRLGSWQRLTYLPGSWKYGALGDLDGDGDLDIVAGFDDETKVYWVENDGSPEDGGWTKHFLGITGAPDQILARDLDGDGALEIIALYKGGPLRILRRPSDPREVWQETVISAVVPGTAGGTVGDVDDDGDLDIVFGNVWYENPLPAQDWVSGAWLARTIDSGWSKEARSCVADIDLDGKSDVVLTGEESSDGIAWYREGDPRSSGNWERTKVNSTTYEKVHSCEVADFNGDGRPDIFVAEMHTSRNKRITVFEQGASPTEWIAHVVATVGSHNAKVGDLDGDGRADIVGKNFEEDMRPRVWFNDVDAKLPLDRWQRHIVETSLPHKAVFIKAGDLDGDGLPDLIAGGWWWPNPGDLGGRWPRKDIGGGLANFAVAHDFDGDGDLDLLGTGAIEEGQGNRFFWAENDGSGSFTVGSVGPGADGDFLQGAEVGEFALGEVAVVLSWHNGQRTEPVKGTQWYRVPARPDQPWTWERIHEFSNEEQIDLGDIDRDGDLDIHLGIGWLRNDGDGIFTLVSGVVLGEGEVDRVRLADIDRDGDLDVVIGAEGANRLVWGENPGGGGEDVWTEHVIATDFNHMSVDVGDVDGDGDIDVVSGAHKGGGEVNVYESDARGRSWSRHPVDAGTSGLIAWVKQLVGAPEVLIDHHDGTQLVDLDQDGDLDIISVGWQHTTVVVYENKAIVGGRVRAASTSAGE